MDKLEEIACKNCQKKNLIRRKWRKDIFCGWCKQEYIIEGKRLVVTLLGEKQPPPKALKK